MTLINPDTSVPLTSNEPERLERIQRPHRQCYTVRQCHIALPIPIPCCCPRCCPCSCALTRFESVSTAPLSLLTGTAFRRGGVDIGLGIGIGAAAADVDKSTMVLPLRLPSLPRSLPLVSVPRSRSPPPKTSTLSPLNRLSLLNLPIELAPRECIACVSLSHAAAIAADNDPSLPGRSP